MALNPTMPMACARTVIMPKEEQRELISVVTQKEFSMPKVYAKTAISVLIIRPRDIVART